MMLVEECGPVTHKPLNPPFSSLSSPPIDLPASPFGHVYREACRGTVKSVTLVHLLFIPYIHFHFITYDVYITFTLHYI